MMVTDVERNCFDFINFRKYCTVAEDIILVSEFFLSFLGKII